MRSSLSFTRIGDLGALRADRRPETHQLPRVPRALSHRNTWYILIFKVSEFGGTITGCPTIRSADGERRDTSGSAAGDFTRRSQWRTTKPADINSAGRPIELATATGRVVLGRSLAVRTRSRRRRRPRAQVKLPQAIADASEADRGDPRPVEGHSTATGHKVARNRSPRSPTASRVFRAALHHILKALPLDRDYSDLPSSRIETLRKLCS